MPNEELVNQIVERCARKISVLLGAGASVPLGLPSMISFWTDVYGEQFVKTIDTQCNYNIAGRKKLTGDWIDINPINALRRLMQTASLTRKCTSLDLEVIYDYIHRTSVLAAGFSDVENVKKLFHFYDITNRHSGGNSPDFSAYQKEYQNFDNRFTTWINDVFGSITELRQKVNETYMINVQNSAVSKAKECFTFLPKLFSCGSPLVFTTNYDTIFEALHVTGGLEEIGYTLQGGYEEKPWQHYFALKNYLVQVDNPLYLFHLHGSVAWERHSDGTIQDHYPYDHKNTAAIVEPVISKNLQKREPFESLYNVFEKSLQKNSVLLVIGFSFRDDAIRDIVEKRFNSEREFHVVCVAPSNSNNSEPELDKHLKELEKKYMSKFIWLKEYFGTPETEAKILKTVNGFVSK